MHNSLENYQGTKIEKHYFKPETVFSQETIYKAARHIAHENLMKGLITEETFSKAMEQLERLEKSHGGEGSRGGHVIGHTKSGKAIYSDKNEDHNDYKDFSKEDHADASDAHAKELKKHRGGYADASLRSKHDNLRFLHNKMANEKEAGESSPKPGKYEIKMDDKRRIEIHVVPQKNDTFIVQTKLYTKKEDGTYSITPKDPKVISNDKYSDFFKDMRDRGAFKKSEEEESEEKLMKAYETLGLKLEKSGEGSRGGHVIGHTRSGKAIYDHADHKSHASFSDEDHKDAYVAHSHKVAEHFKSAKDYKDKKHSDKMMHHDKMKHAHGEKISQYKKDGSYSNVSFKESVDHFKKDK